MAKIQNILPMGVTEAPHTISTGSLTTLSAGKQFTSLVCDYVRFKAATGNTGTCFIGEAANPTAFPLYAGDDTGWIPVSNVNQFFVKDSVDADVVAFMALL